MQINRAPTSPGAMLRYEFLEPLALSQAALAHAMGVSPRLVNELCRNKRAITADSALMLARVFGNTPDFWLNCQQRTDLWQATHDAARRARIERAQPLAAQLQEINAYES